MRFVLGTMMLAVAMLAIGCEGDVSATGETADAGAAPPPPAPTPPGDGKQAAPAGAGQMPTTTEPAAAVADTPETTQPATPQGGTTEVATATSGAKGRDYGGPGFVTTPIQEYFRAGAQINLLHMANSLKIYKAGHDNKGPKTHDEFMEVIVKENGIDLPELPEGEEYLYDPMTEQLMVRRPEK